MRSTAPIGKKKADSLVLPDIAPRLTRRKLAEQEEAGSVKEQGGSPVKGGLSPSGENPIESSESDTDLAGGEARERRVNGVKDADGFTGQKTCKSETAVEKNTMVELAQEPQTVRMTHGEARRPKKPPGPMKRELASLGLGAGGRHSTRSKATSRRVRASQI